MPRTQSPLNPDTVVPLTPMPVRISLLAKLNAFAIGLILVTALGIVVLLARQQLADEQMRVRTQGMTVVSMLAEWAEPAVLSNDRVALAQMTNSLAGDRDIAYVAVLDKAGKTLLAHAFGDLPVPANPVERPGPEKIVSGVQEYGGHRFLEFITPIGRPKTDPLVLRPSATIEPPNAGGYIRLGMSLNRSLMQMRSNLLGALTVVAVLVAVAIVVTLLLTRRLVAPIRQVIAPVFRSNLSGTSMRCKSTTAW